MLKAIPLLINTYQRELDGQAPQPAQTSGPHCLLWNCTPVEGLGRNTNLATGLMVLQPMPRLPTPDLSVVIKFTEKNTCTALLLNVPRRLEPNSGTSVFIKQPFILSGYIWLPYVAFRCGAPNTRRR